MTNVRNKRADSESTLSLQPRANGLIKSFERRQTENPLLLYLDRDCCSSKASTSGSKLKALLASWLHWIFRLDISHHTRRRHLLFILFFALSVFFFHVLCLTWLVTFTLVLCLIHPVSLSFILALYFSKTLPWSYHYLLGFCSVL